MPPDKWRSERGRPDIHVKDGRKERGETATDTEEIAACTFQRGVGSGLSTCSHRVSTHRISSTRRGELHAHRGADGRTPVRACQKSRFRGVEGPPR